MIELYGLSPIEVELADKMWQFQEEEELFHWMNTLPTKRLRALAQSIYTCIVYAAIDEEIEDSELELANEVIDSVK
jgi:hypothetical protein